jgi:hypothetical protein
LPIGSGARICVRIRRLFPCLGIRVGGKDLDRYGILEDPFGHRWSIATHKRDVTEKEMREAMKAMRAGNK